MATQVEKITAVINKPSISLRDTKELKSLKVKMEKRLPEGFKIKLNFSNIYTAQKVDGKWVIDMQTGSSFLREICPKTMDSIADICDQIRAFDLEGGQ